MLSKTEFLKSDPFRFKQRNLYNSYSSHMVTTKSMEIPVEAAVKGLGLHSDQQ